MSSFKVVSHLKECSSAFFRRNLALRLPCNSFASGSSPSYSRISKSCKEGKSGHVPPCCQASWTRSRMGPLMDHGTRPMASSPARTPSAKPRFARRNASLCTSHPCVRIAAARNLKKPPFWKPRHGRGSTNIGRNRGVAAHWSMIGSPLARCRSSFDARTTPTFRFSFTTTSCSNSRFPSLSTATSKNRVTKTPPSFARVIVGQSASSASSSSKAFFARALTTCCGNRASAFASRKRPRPNFALRASFASSFASSSLSPRRDARCRRRCCLTRKTRASTWIASPNAVTREEYLAPGSPCLRQWPST
mmetsp:Transcript_10386/g.30521  ORF Transcript_10386/g.30521 Transcript_10386/m.30521 type:complete len:306 (-) Transcript_10386:668-1585(-)